ncbi:MULTISPECIES: hypothetical protein [unclassified Thermoactinomyces]|jgi:hypothetical protein|nr:MULTISPECIES: hypothetical protein [unclassified Thermoactinomyces]MBH8597306.1 hypothetical protein [Thermoactinomyces sp. CICC 10523]MBH8602867.1 hypothetical protein [Thermoactinomyces sp. CICC 10522]
MKPRKQRVEFYVVNKCETKTKEEVVNALRAKEKVMNILIELALVE